MHFVSETFEHFVSESIQSSALKDQCTQFKNIYLQTRNIIFVNVLTLVCDLLTSKTIVYM